MKNDKIIIEHVTETRSTVGGLVESWSTFTTVWADVDQISGNENFNSDMIVYSDFKRFTCYYSETRGVTAKMRIKYRDEYYDIRSISDSDRLNTVITAMRHDDE
jgi:SPP1 family predicted phage head-tail adaptor